MVVVVETGRTDDGLYLPNAILPWLYSWSDIVCVNATNLLIWWCSIWQGDEFLPVLSKGSDRGSGFSRQKDPHFNVSTFACHFPCTAFSCCSLKAILCLHLVSSHDLFPTHFHFFHSTAFHREMTSLGLQTSLFSACSSSHYPWALYTSFLFPLPISPSLAFHHLLHFLSSSLPSFFCPSSTPTTVPFLVTFLNLHRLQQSPNQVLWAILSSKGFSSHLRQQPIC